MDFPPGLLPDGLVWAANLVALGWLLHALRRVPWSRLLNDSGFSHVLFGACVALLVLWNLRAGIQPALNYHLLGATTLTLMVGWPLASLGMAVVVLGTALNHGEGVATFGINLLTMGLLPILLTQGLLQLAQRRLPHNFFIYVYINAFLAGGLAMVAAGVAGSLVMWAAGVHEPGWLAERYLIYFPMLFFSEALANGMVTTMLVALRPAWVCSFDDALYIDGK